MQQTIGLIAAGVVVATYAVALTLSDRENRRVEAMPAGTIAESMIKSTARLKTRIYDEIAGTLPAAIVASFIVGIAFLIFGEPAPIRGAGGTDTLRPSNRDRPPAQEEST